MPSITYHVAPVITDSELNQLFASAWNNHVDRIFGAVLRRSLTYLCAYDGPRIVGFANVAWDGGLHAFLLDVTVHADYQRRGIGRELVERVKEVATQRQIEWLHVDYELQLEAFYRACGFQETKAGILNLSEASDRRPPAPQHKPIR
jgi:ribosomal protein S18 acetylase RimI-like enzyme